ncbi:hypothetical protein TCAL_08430 [Tigriopus californicus]|uniref:FACT complex subunit n=1 Tax=Tigriopus californicus TaxID=6832 RepID=A0A553N7F8_TIGCA|nr:FACT complex subunit SPT16-like [Tigriopus californicus]TRY61376.1 hypothetical protein TCAL_08430 [Tigriopus californicus]
MSGLKMDVEAFFRRAKRFYQVWKDPSLSSYPQELSSMDAFLCVVGQDEDTVYAKSVSWQTWLVGYELTDTLMLFTEGAVLCLASKKKIEFLRALESPPPAYEGHVPPVRLLIRDKADNDRKNFDKVLEAIRESKQGATLGIFVKDQKFPGTLPTAWRAFWDKEKGSIASQDVTNALAYCMAPKEETELAATKKAAGVTSEVFSKFLKEQIMDIIDQDKSVKHSKLSEGVEKAIVDKKYGQNVDTSLLESCYPPILQSGGNYKLKFSVVSDKENVHFGAIICAFGARYKSYCSNIVRTMLVDPSDEIQKTYEFLVSLEEHILSKLKDGAVLGKIYDSVVSMVKSDKPQLMSGLTKNFGFAMGIEFREAALSIAKDSQVKAKKGMVFNINIGFSGLTNKSSGDTKGKNIALFVGDTVLVGEGAPATLLTPSKKKIKNIAIFLKDADSSEEEKENKNTRGVDHESFGRGKRSAVLDQKLRQDTTAEEKRKAHQRELMQKMNEEALRRIKSGGDTQEKVKVRKAPVSYKSPGQLPRESEVKQLKIYVDKKYETIILPIFGIPTPFHIATIKNISTSVEGDFTYLRINFFHPGASIGKEGGGSFAYNPEAIFLKELTYRSTNVREPGEISAPSSNLNTAFRLIKDIQKKYKTREAEQKEMADLVEQDTLVISTNKGNPKLKDLYIRPNIVQKRLSGVLEAHGNGFRYTSIRGDKIDVLYNNIKHAFFHPCDGEMIILLHFHLRNAILFGKKKHTDVQFYTEVGEITTDLGKHQHMHDRDDLAAEQAERELRHKLKQAFRSFCDKVAQVTKDDLEFDVPFRELGFHGVPFRETVLLQPTGTSLVNLTSWPPFVITLEDIQLVHFERVQFQLKNFDMVFIFKDYNKKVMMVTTIPMTMLDHVKEWLNSVDIKYTEGVQSLNWPKIMKTIVDDPEGFFESGGWSFLDPDSDGEEEDDEEDSEDEEFRMSGSASDEAFDESEEDYSSEVSEESFSEEELDSDESSGKDWSDLEREAAEDDRYDDTSEVPPRSSKEKSKHRSSPSKKHRSSDKSASSSHGGKRDHRDRGGRDRGGRDRDRHSDKRKREGSSSSKHHKTPKKSRR